MTRADLVYDDGVADAIGRETVLLGKHAWVQRFPHLFALEGDPADQSAHPRRSLRCGGSTRGPSDESESDMRILEGQMRAKRAVKLDVDGEQRRVRKGDLLDPSELIVSLVPDAFERVSVEHKR